MTGQQEYIYLVNETANFMPGWSVTDFRFENLVVSSYSLLAMIEIGEAICKKFRLPFATLSTQVTKNTKEKLNLRVKDICELSVRKLDIGGFGATSLKVRVL